MSLGFRSPIRKKTGFYTRSPVSIHGARAPIAYKGKFRSPIRRPRMIRVVGGGLGGGLGGGMLFGQGSKKKQKKSTPKAKAPRGLRFRGPGSNAATKAPKLGGGFRRLW